MSSLKETIERFEFCVNEYGDRAVYVEDIPGIVVAALQDLADAFRKESDECPSSIQFSHDIEMRYAANVIAVYQQEIVHELM